MSEPWRVKYDGVCGTCGTPLTKGAPAVWDRASKTIRCVECPQADVPTSIDPGVAGRSARAEHDRRAAKRDARITERWGTGFVAKVVRTLSEEPQSTRAWSIGAAGEEKLAAELDKVPGLRMLHDRRVPGTRGNIDHIVVAPAGVFIVDAKNHSGQLAIRDRGGLFRTDYRLTVAGRDCSALADKVGWQVDAVCVALDGVDPMPPIVPVLCFLNVEWPLFRAPEEFHGVRLESHRSIKKLLTATAAIDDERAEALAARLAHGLPAK